VSDTLERVGLVVLLAMVAVWFVLISWLFRRLKRQHPAMYERLGSPSLFWNNSIRNNWLFMKFLLGSRWRELGDASVATACRFMRVFLVVYLMLLVALIGGTFAMALSQP
jgi:hypothetical protein